MRGEKVSEVRVIEVGRESRGSERKLSGMSEGS